MPYRDLHSRRVLRTATRGRTHRIFMLRMHSHVDQIRPDMQHAVQLAKPKRRSLDRNIAVLRRLSVDCTCAWWRLFSIFRRVGLLAPAELGIPITATLRRERLCHVCRSQHALFTHRACERPDEAQARSIDDRACCVRSSNFIRISFQESGLHHCTYSYTDEGQPTTRSLFGRDRGRRGARTRAPPRTPTNNLQSPRLA